MLGQKLIHQLLQTELTPAAHNLAFASAPLKCAMLQDRSFGAAWSSSMLRQQQESLSAGILVLSHALNARLLPKLD